MFEIQSETENGLNDDGLHYGHRDVCGGLALIVHSVCETVSGAGMFLCVCLFGRGWVWLSRWMRSCNTPVADHNQAQYTDCGLLLTRFQSVSGATWYSWLQSLPRIEIMC